MAKDKIAKQDMVKVGDVYDDLKPETSKYLLK